VARRGIKQCREPIRHLADGASSSISRASSHAVHVRTTSRSSESFNVSERQRYFTTSVCHLHHKRAFPPLNNCSSPLLADAISTFVLPSATVHSSTIDILNLISCRRGFATETSKKAAPPVSPASDVEDDKQSSLDGAKAQKATTASSPSKPSDAPKSTAITEKKDSSIVKKAADATLWAAKSLISMLAKMPGVMWFYMTHPKEFRKKLGELKEAAVKEAHHYWMGSKLLAADIRTARHILGRTLRGSTLSRRERKQLLRTVTDVFRLVPMSIFVLVPFMEFALPFALKLFPNMLPSTFQDSLKEEEKMKRELQMRISMAGFFQDTLTELAKEQKKSAEIRKHDAVEESDAESIEIEKEASAASFLDFLKQARTGEPIPPDAIIKFAGYFEDNLTLDNMERMQLIPMCRYMGVPPYGNDNLLRFQLRHKIRLLREDDQRILWEGIDSLTKMELREACRERGMRSTGLSKDAYKKSLQEWLELSVRKNVPISLLIMSRTFYLHDEMVSGDSSTDESSKRVAGLADAMSGIDKDVLNEIVLEMASSEEKQTNADVMKIQLEVLEHQNELIKEEQEERDAAAREKAEDERKKKEKEEREKEQATDTSEEESVDKPKAEDHSDGLSADTKETEVKPTAGDTTTEKTFVDSPVEEVVSNSATGKAVDEESDDEEEQTKLSTDEIEAISQLASPDPVFSERQELQRIKDAILAESKSNVEAKSDGADDEILQKEQTEDASLEMTSAISPDEPIYTDEAQKEALETIKEFEELVEIEKEAKNVTSLKGDTGAKLVVEYPDDEDAPGDKKLQKAIDRLKSRVESMVGKIETQLSDVEVKIGNKFHLLDKDLDGVLTMEEMAEVLQTVLKRTLTNEEAMAIAQDMDTNKDGVFSIQELAHWAESNTIVKLAEDGREKDVNELITKRVEDLHSKEKKKLKEEDEEWQGL